MNEDEVQQQLRSLVGSQKKVQLTRDFPSEPRLNGFVLGIGREWVLIHTFHDFYPEGYAALRVRDIISIRSGEHERHWEYMLAAEGHLARIVIPIDFPLDHILQLLRELQIRGQNVIVECEDIYEDLEDFYIGQILSVDEESLHFANFDGLGQWDDSPHTIKIEEITKVQFETPYVQTFSKYLKGSCHLPRGNPIQ